MPIEGGTPAGIAAAVAAARADQVILCLGEAAWMSGEAASRARIDLPGRQAELAAAVLATGKPVTVLLFSGRPIAMPEVFASAAAVVACWFPGSEAGHAVADLLTGATAPTAGLAVTWPRDVGQVPIAYSVRSGGRPENPADKYTSKYLDLPNTPQFPFGHGLAYTELRPDRPVVTVGRPHHRRDHGPPTSARAPGATTVFLFIRDPVASVARPVLELKRLHGGARPGRDATPSASSSTATTSRSRAPTSADGRGRGDRDPRRLLRRPRRAAQHQASPSR